MSWIYDDQWVQRTEAAIRATYTEAGAPYDTTAASVWNARCVSQAASGTLTRQKARWSTLNALRKQLGLASLAPPVWCGEEAGTLRVEGLQILNDNPRPGIGTLPWMCMGYRMFDAFGLHLYGIRDFRQSLDYPCELGFNTIFISTMMRAANGHPVDLSPELNADLYQKLEEARSIAEGRKMRLFVYACADAQFMLPDYQKRVRHCLKVAEILQGGFHIPSYVNEGPNNGVPNSETIPTPSNCPVWSRGSMGEFPNPQQAPIAEFEVRRRNLSEEPFKMSADCASVEYLNEERSGPKLQRPVIGVEHTFAASFQQLGRRSNEPRLFRAQAGAQMITREYGSGGYAFGSENSRMGEPLTGQEHACAEAAIQTMRRAW